MSDATEQLLLLQWEKDGVTLVGKKKKKQAKKQDSLLSSSLSVFATHWCQILIGNQLAKQKSGFQRFSPYFRSRKYRRGCRPERQQLKKLVIPPEKSKCFWGTIWGLLLILLNYYLEIYFNNLNSFFCLGKFLIYWNLFL